MKEDLYCSSGTNLLCFTLLYFVKLIIWMDGNLLGTFGTSTLGNNGTESR